MIISDHDPKPRKHLEQWLMIQRCDQKAASLISSEISICNHSPSSLRGRSSMTASLRSFVFLQTIHLGISRVGSCFRRAVKNNKNIKNTTKTNNQRSRSCHQWAPFWKHFIVFISILHTKILFQWIVLHIWI